MQTRIIYDVYCHTFSNGKSYIGKSYDTKARLKDHIRAAFDPTSREYNLPFKRAIRKYGIDDITTTILFQTPNEDTAYEAEKYFIAINNTYLGEGYNGSDGGKKPPSRKGCTPWNKNKKGLQKHNSNTRKRISENNKGRTAWNKNKSIGKQSKETINKRIQKTSKSYKIIFPNQEQKIIKNLSKFCRENNLTIGLMIAVAKGRQTHHKQFKCYYIN